MLKRCLLAVFFIMICLFSACAEESGELVYEAKDARLLGSAYIQKIAGHTFVTGLEKEGDGFVLTVDVPASGFYDLIFSQKSPNGAYKENTVQVDGINAGSVSAEKNRWTEATLEFVYLTAGSHEIGLTKSWGWVYTESLAIRPSQALSEDLYDVEPTLCNPNASDNAKRLMTYLCDCYGKVTLSGQYCDDGMYGSENATIWRTTGGKYPAILGLDLIEYSPSRVSHGSSSTAIEKAIEYWQKGGIVTFCWHWNAPEKYITGQWYSAFYTHSCNLDLAAIMNGQDEEGYALLMSDIDVIAKQLTRLKDAGVPVLWRPLHEASGGWFWWGNAGADAYLKLYRLLYDKLTYEYGLNNLIWVWNGQDADWYPGDEYVDIIGWDIYPGEHVYSSQAATFLKATRVTSARKLITLSENGCLPDPEEMARDGIIWSYFGTWSGEFVVKNKNFNLYSEQYTEAEMLNKVYWDEKIITRDELPDLTTYPLRNAD